MKTEQPSMKMETTSDDDPISAAAAALARAVDRAIVTARNEPSPALVASEAKCDALNAKITALEVTVRALSTQHDSELGAKDLVIADLRTQLTALNNAATFAQKELSAALILAVKRDTELRDKSRAIAQSENQCTALRAQLSTLKASAQVNEATLARDKQVLATGRMDLANAREILRVERASFEAEQLKLAADQARVAADQEKLLCDKRATLKTLQRTVSTIQAEVAQQERSRSVHSAAPNTPRSHASAQGASFATSLKRKRFQEHPGHTHLAAPKSRKTSEIYPGNSNYDSVEEALVNAWGAGSCWR
ncbi:hypothetical protein C8R44DRAFT_812286 [Mycena epipterygia]|nr:hypothetical protein C8R44DRAFT_812286 [Mycena epipterygia]